MIECIKSKLNLKKDFYSKEEYKDVIGNLIQHKMVISMQNFIQHGDISCLEHSINVSYNSYVICKKLNLDYRSAARGGLLHDFFLYDWHGKNPYKGWHGFIHSNIALQNAKKYFNLNTLEMDIIQKHMWPLTIKFPSFKESFVVAFVDKYCAIMETRRYVGSKDLHKIKETFGI